MLAAVAVITFVLMRFGLMATGVKAAHLSALETVVPAQAELVLTVDVAWFLEQAIEENFGLFAANDPDALRETLSEASQTYFGVDLLEAEQAVLWFSAELGTGAVFLAGDFEVLAGSGPEEMHNGVRMVAWEGQLWAAVVEDGLALGQRRGVQRAIDISLGDAETLAADEERLARHQAALDAVEDGPFIASVHATELVGLGEGSEMYWHDVPESEKPPRTGALSAAVEGKVVLAVLGERSQLSTLAEEFERGKEEAEEAVQSTLDQMRVQEVGEGVLAGLYARAKLKEMLALSQVELGEDALIVTSQIPPQAVPIVGALAGLVGVPALVKYQHQAKTSEAMDGLDRIAKRAANYYVTPRVDPGTGEPLPCQFPASQEMTPDVRDSGCCGGVWDRNGDNLCDVNPALWEAPTWRALYFEITTPHRFAYSFHSEGTGNEARFTVKAYADLQCDGQLTGFERRGYGESQGGGCSVRLDGGGMSEIRGNFDGVSP